jgi:hypothetical protein
MPDWAATLVIYPMGDAHILSSAEGMYADPDLALYRRPNDRRLPMIIHQNGGGDQRCHLVCGYFGCDSRPFNPLLDALPRMFHAKIPAAGRSWLLEPSLTALSRNISARRPAHG